MKIEFSGFGSLTIYGIAHGHDVPIHLSGELILLPTSEVITIWNTAHQGAKAIGLFHVTC